MRIEETIQINTHAVVERIRALGLKQWWLAEQIGVTPKTVQRWVTGRVTRVDRRNADRLAQQLECSVTDITLGDAADVFATREQQRAAARLIKERNLLLLLSPSDNWELAETLIKATMQPNLPLRQLGMLYNLLSIAAWRQGHYDEGLEHAMHARALGERCGDPTVVQRAVLNIATIDSIVGRCMQARAQYERALAEPRHFESRNDHAAALSNVAAVYRDFGQFEESLAAQRAAIAMYEELQMPYNLAIAWISMCLALTELGETDGARDAVERARICSREAGFDRGIDSLLVYGAGVLTMCGRHDEAVRDAREGMARLHGHPVYDLECNEIAVRVFRRAGLYEEAHTHLERALAASKPFGVQHARTLQEASRLASAIGDDEVARRHAADADRLYVSMGIRARVADAPLQEYGCAPYVHGPGAETGITKDS